MEPYGPHVIFVYIRVGLYKVARLLFISLASNLVVNLSNIFHHSQQATTVQFSGTSLPLD